MKFTLKEYLKDTRDAFKAGDLAEAYHKKDFRIVPA